jgi:type I restriction enzyme S subunit
MSFPVVSLASVLKQRKEFIIIDDDTEYKLCRVQTNRKGVVLRSLTKGLEIKTKKQQVCKAGDLLVAEIDAKVGGYGFVPDELEGAIVSGHYFLFELEPLKIRQEYFEILLKTEIIQDQIRSVGSTNYAAIRPADFLSYSIPLPSVSEQQVIAEKHSRISRETAEFDHETASAGSLLISLRQAILQDAVSGKLVPQNPNDEPASELLKRIRAEKAKMVKEGTLRKEKPLPPIDPDEVPFELPQGWEWCRLGEAVIVNPRNKRPTEMTCGFMPMPYLPVALSESVRFDERVWGEIKGSFTHFQDDDVVVAKITPCFENGKSAIVRNLPNGFGAGTTELHVLRPLSGNLPVFFLLFVKRQKFINAGEVVMTGSAGQKRVPTSYIEDTIFALPPLPEQHRIVDKARQLLAQCDEMERALQKSRNLANALKSAIVHGLVGEARQAT